MSNVIIEGFIVAYKRCGLDTQYKEKMVPGMNTKCHTITGTIPCTLYEVKVAACANEGQGLFSVPVIIRTGGKSSPLKDMGCFRYQSNIGPLVSHHKRWTRIYVGNKDF